MATQQLVAIIFFLLGVRLTAAAGGGGASPLIASTCAAMTKATIPTSYDYCVRTLSSHPSTASAADARGLAAAAANLTVASAESALRVLDRLVVASQDCLDGYEAMRGSIARAVDDLLHGVAADDVDLLGKLRVSFLQPDICDLSFMESNTHKNPMEAENGENGRLSRLAYGITETLRT